MNIYHLELNKLYPLSWRECNIIVGFCRSKHRPPHRCVSKWKGQLLLWNKYVIWYTCTGSHSQESDQSGLWCWVPFVTMVDISFCAFDCMRHLFMRMGLFAIRQPSSYRALSVLGLPHSHRMKYLVWQGRRLSALLVHTHIIDQNIGDSNNRNSNNIHDVTKITKCFLVPLQNFPTKKTEITPKYDYTGWRPVGSCCVLQKKVYPQVFYLVTRALPREPPFERLNRTISCGHSESLLRNAKAVLKNDRQRCKA